MNRTGVAANKKVLPPGNSCEWERRRGLFLRWAFRMWLSYRDCPGPVLIRCVVDIPQAQVERISVCSPDFWAHYHPAPTSPNKTKPCHRSSWLTFTQRVLLNNGRGCTLQWSFYRKEGVWPHTGRAPDLTWEVERPGIRVSPLPRATLLSGPVNPTLFQPVHSSVVDSGLIQGWFRHHQGPTQICSLDPHSNPASSVLRLFPSYRWGCSYPGGSQQMQETQVQSPGWEDLLEEEMATHTSILAWEAPWREEPGRLQSRGSQKSWTRLNDWPHLHR